MLMSCKGYRIKIDNFQTRQFYIEYYVKYDWKFSSYIFLIDSKSQGYIIHFYDPGWLFDSILLIYEYTKLCVLRAWRWLVCKCLAEFAARPVCGSPNRYIHYEAPFGYISHLNVSKDSLIRGVKLRYQCLHKYKQESVYKSKIFSFEIEIFTGKVQLSQKWRINGAPNFRGIYHLKACFANRLTNRANYTDNGRKVSRRFRIFPPKARL